MVEAQRQRLMGRRQAVLADREDGAWHWRPNGARRLRRSPGRRPPAARSGRPRSAASTRRGADPLIHFSAEIATAFDTMEESVDRLVLDAMPAPEAGLDGLVRVAAIKAPSSTWTYIVSDDPFRYQILQKPTGPGRTSTALYSALALGPLLILWGLADRFRVRQRLAGIHATRRPR